MEAGDVLGAGVTLAQAAGWLTPPGAQLLTSAFSLSKGDISPFQFLTTAISLYYPPARMLFGAFDLLSGWFSGILGGNHEIDRGPSREELEILRIKEWEDKLGEASTHEDFDMQGMILEGYAEPLGYAYWNGSNVTFSLSDYKAWSAFTWNPDTRLVVGFSPADSFEPRVTGLKAYSLSSLAQMVAQHYANNYRTPEYVALTRALAAADLAKTAALQKALESGETDGLGLDERVLDPYRAQDGDIDCIGDDVWLARYAPLRARRLPKNACKDLNARRAAMGLHPVTCLSYYLDVAGEPDPPWCPGPGYPLGPWTWEDQRILSIVERDLSGLFFFIARKHNNTYGT